MSRLKSAPTTAVARASAWSIHFYTASGAVFSFLALIRILESRYREAFIWLLVTVVVDATDGVLY